MRVRAGGGERLTDHHHVGEDVNTVQDLFRLDSGQSVSVKASCGGSWHHIGNCGKLALEANATHSEEDCWVDCVDNKAQQKEGVQDPHEDVAGLSITNATKKLHHPQSSTLAIELEFR